MEVEENRMSVQRVALLLDNLSGGGAERVVLGLASEFATLGYEVDLLVCDFHGVLCDSIPSGVNLVELEANGQLAGLWAALRSSGDGIGGIASFIASAHKIPRSFRYITALRKYLLAQRPAVLFSALPKASICAAFAVASIDVETRVFVGIQNTVSERIASGRREGKGQMRHQVALLRHCYLQADGVIASSAGVAEDVINFLNLEASRVHVVYNPVHIPESVTSEQEPPIHSWLQAGAAPVILGIGRLVEQKNFPLLIRAFAVVRQRTNARLLILGGDAESKDQMVARQSLLSLAAELGIADDVDLPGYRPNPHDYLGLARVFVLSSRYEGFGNVLVEALLAGCPIVSTDCPSGPSEILDGGRFGALVPVDDVDSLAQAILYTLSAAPQSELLRRRGGEFSLDRAVNDYQRLFFEGNSSPVLARSFQ
jgi:glycosyltransferase involved in cell wall biosynthesis